MIKSDVYMQYEKKGFIDAKSKCCEAELKIEWFDNVAYLICTKCNKRLKIVAKDKNRYGCY